MPINIPGLPLSIPVSVPSVVTNALLPVTDAVTGVDPTYGALLALINQTSASLFSPTDTMDENYIKVLTEIEATTLAYYADSRIQIAVQDVEIAGVAGQMLADSQYSNVFDAMNSQNSDISNYLANTSDISDDVLVYNIDSITQAPDPSVQNPLKYDKTIDTSQYINTDFNNGDIQPLWLAVSDHVHTELINRNTTDSYNINKDAATTSQQDNKKIYINTPGVTNVGFDLEQTPGSMDISHSGTNKTVDTFQPLDNYPIHGKDYVYNNLMQNISDFNANNQDFNPQHVQFYGASSTQNDPTLFKGWASRTTPKGKKFIPDAAKMSTKDTPFSQEINDSIQQMYGKASIDTPPGAYRFFIEKLHGRYDNGDPYKKNPIASQLGITGNNNLSNRMVFSAYIDGFSDQFSSQKSEYNFLGRGESVSMYKNTTRSMSISFSIIADFSLDYFAAMQQLNQAIANSTNVVDQIQAIQDAKLDWGNGYMIPPIQKYDGQVGNHIPGKYSDTPNTLWLKLNFLAQCVYPYYRTDGKMKEQPLIRLRVTDMFDLVCTIKDYTLDFNDFSNMIDLNPSYIGHVPMAVKVNMNLQVIHDDEPSSNYFGFYNRREFDNGEISRQTGVGLLSIDNNNSSGSSTTNPVNGTSANPSVLQNGTANYNNQLSSYKSSYNNLTTVTQNTTSSLAAKQAAQDAMNAYIRVAYVANQIAAQMGIGSNSVSVIGGASIPQNSNSTTTQSKQYSSSASNQDITNTDLIINGSPVVIPKSANNISTTAPLVSQPQTLQDIINKSVKTTPSAPSTQLTPISNAIPPASQAGDIVNTGSYIGSNVG